MSSGRGTNRFVPSSAPGRDTHPLTDIQSSSSTSPSARPRNPSADAQQRVAPIHADPHRDTDRGVHPRREAAGVEHGETQRPLTRLGTAGRACTIVRSRSVRTRVKLPPRICHRPVEPPVGDEVGRPIGWPRRIPSTASGSVVAPDADQLRLVAGRSRAAAPRRGRALCRGSGRTRSANRRAGRGRGSSPGRPRRAAPRAPLDVIGRDGLAVEVARTLGDEHDVARRRPAWRPARSTSHIAVSQSSPGGLSGMSDEVRAGRQAAHQGQIAAVAAHHLDDEGALVARGRALDRVDCLDDSVQRGVGADRHVGAEHVVVDRADQPDQSEVPMGVRIAPRSPRRRRRARPAAPATRRATRRRR